MTRPKSVASHPTPLDVDRNASYITDPYTHTSLTNPHADSNPHTNLNLKTRAETVPIAAASRLLAPEDEDTHSRRARLAVVIPFTDRNVEALAESLATWQKHFPCVITTTRRDQAPTLVLYFSHDLDRDEALAHKVHAIVDSLSDPLQCFKRVEYKSAALYGEDDVYDKRRLTGKWVRGPNMFFYKMLDCQDLRSRFDFVFWMETDTRPIRPLWLDVLWSLADRSAGAWIIGSAFRGHCVVSKIEGREACELLGGRIVNHINGNALFAIADPSFIEFEEEVRASENKDWPFDLAPYVHLRTLPEERLRGLFHRFVHHDFIHNYGSYPFSTEKLREQNHVYLVHGDNPDNVKGVEVPGWHIATTTTAKKISPHTETTSHSATTPATTPASDSPLPTTIPPSNLPPVMVPKTLHRALLAKANRKKQIVILWSHDGDGVLFDNWLLHIGSAGITNFIVVTDDPNLAKRARGRCVVFRHNTLQPPSSCIALQASILRLGFTILLTNIETIWLTTPFTLLENGTDFQIQGSVSNPLIYARPSEPVIALFDFVASTLPLLNKTTRAVWDDTLHTYQRAVSTSVLDPGRFPRVEEMKHASNPAAVSCAPTTAKPFPHATTIYRFREMRLWKLDPPDYFSKALRKYVTYTPPPKGNTMNNQWMALRNTLAIAKTLGRTPILPPSFSSTEDTLVTMDFFFDMERFSETFSDFREHSFLESVFSDRDIPTFAIRFGMDNESPRGVDATSRVIFEPEDKVHGASDTEIFSWFEEFDEEPLLQLEGPIQGWFGSFGDAERNARFKEKLQRGLVVAPELRMLIDRVINGMGEDSFDCLHASKETSVEEGLKKRIIKLLGSDRPLLIIGPAAETWAEVLASSFTSVSTVRTSLSNEIPASERFDLLEYTACTHGRKVIADIRSTKASLLCHMRELDDRACLPLTK